ncbi:D-alanyl-D-alanine carboxypeptidase [Candidatus Roizmanbacteria bacterium]|nr:D-alanyl-D-alanine carboxypeptidase [Candidatus Roizmanbacteria bacterium]
MKKVVSFFFTTLIIAVISSACFVYFISINQKDTHFFSSPIPDFLNLSKNKQVTLLDLWLPFIQKTYGSEDKLDLTAKSALVFDLTTEKAVFEKNSHERLPMASLTKIMTAIISLEDPRKDNQYVVAGQDLVGEDSMGLSNGEVLKLEELLYGLMLPSGNDAAEVLASDSPFGRKGFIKAMNEKAKALGLKDTSFSNPSGLQGDGSQYTTVYDLLVITRYAMDNFPLFTEIVAKPEYGLSETPTHKAYNLISETNLLTTYAGVKGVKTGYTPEAGLCLVTYLDYGGHKLIGVILNSENRRGEMKGLLDYSLKSLGIEPPVFRGGL